MKVFWGPISAVLVLEKFVMLFVWLIIGYYTIFFFLIPCFESDFGSHLPAKIFTLYWLAIMMIWIHSYVYVSWFDPGSVRAEIARFHHKEAVYSELLHLPKCVKCNAPKPSRAHHCSQCKTCYIRFDHHCPTVGNCIAYRNAQPFVIYLSYGALILFTTSVISAFAWLFQCPLSRTLTNLISAVIGICSMILMSFAYTTISGLWSDETTLERIYRAKMGYHMAMKENLVPIWGTRKWKWFVAHSPEMNGLIWANALPANIDEVP